MIATKLEKVRLTSQPKDWLRLTLPPSKRGLRLVLLTLVAEGRDRVVEMFTVITKLSLKHALLTGWLGPTETREVTLGELELNENRGYIPSFGSFVLHIQNNIWSKLLSQSKSCVMHTMCYTHNSNINSTQHTRHSHP